MIYCDIFAVMREKGGELLYRMGEERKGRLREMAGRGSITGLLNEIVDGWLEGRGVSSAPAVPTPIVAVTTQEVFANGEPLGLDETKAGVVEPETPRDEGGHLGDRFAEMRERVEAKRLEKAKLRNELGKYL